MGSSVGYAPGVSSSSIYFLASRFLWTGSTGGFAYYLTSVQADGTIYVSSDFLYNSDTSRQSNAYTSIRPVVIFKSGIMMEIGDGTSENPYEVN